MLKSIPKSNISEKRFYVYKEWSQTEADSPVYEGFSETGSGAFDTATATEAVSGSGVYASPLWHSIKTKYYSTNGDVIIQSGVVRNPGQFNAERDLGSTIYVIQIPQIKYGEQIKKGSVVLEDVTNSNTYYDDGFGGITTIDATYSFVSYDIETQIITFYDPAQAENEELTLSFFDVNTGIGTFTYNGDTQNLAVLQVDFQAGIITFSEAIDFSDLSLSAARVGNIFYDDGIIVLNDSGPFTEYLLQYRSTVEITETEVLLSVKEGEFNISQNPTAVDVTLYQTSSFTTTPITNVSPGGTVKIKEVLDISQKQYFTSSFDGVTVGTWNDYSESGSIDPTGSYLAPYITTIGLYDDNYDMVAVAKLPTPIKNLPDWDINFIVRFDT